METPKIVKHKTTNAELIEWSIQAGETDAYDGQYRMERSMGSMVNTGWRDRCVRWSIQAGEI